jgi:voltage-gated potassium channel
MKLEQDPVGRVSTPLEPLVLVATLAMIPILILENDAKGGWKTFAFAANWAIWLVFAAEVIVIFAGAARRGAAARAHWLEIAVVVVTIPVFGRLLGSLRLLRLARLLRLMRASMIVGRALRAEKRLSSVETFRFLALITVFVVVIAGASEATFDSGDFPTIWSGVWWAVVTVTTVGYGDLYPRSVGGRLIGMLVMLVGIGFLSVLTATVASHFVKTDRSGGEAEILERLERIEEALAKLNAAAG